MKGFLVWSLFLSFGDYLDLDSRVCKDILYEFENINPLELF